MPQMAPIMWISLFITFSILFLFSMIKISFSKKSSTMHNMNNMIKASVDPLNWKW